MTLLRRRLRDTAMAAVGEGGGRGASAVMEHQLVMFENALVISHVQGCRMRGMEPANIPDLVLTSPYSCAVRALKGIRARGKR